MAPFICGIMFLKVETFKFIKTALALPHYGCYKNSRRSFCDTVCQIYLDFKDLVSQQYHQTMTWRWYLRPMYFYALHQLHDSHGVPKNDHTCICTVTNKPEKAGSIDIFVLYSFVLDTDVTLPNIIYNLCLSHFASRVCISHMLH